MAEPLHFPRQPDGQGWAWGLDDATPTRVWERFSPAYEAQVERIVRALEWRGLAVFLAGAGSQDGEYVLTQDAEGQYHFFTHTEDPGIARRIAAMDDAALARWIDEFLSDF